MRVVETSGPVGCKGHDMPLAERVVQRPRHIVGQAFRPHLVIDGVLAAKRGITFEVLAHHGGTVMDFVGGTTDVFGSLPDIVVDSRNLGPAYPASSPPNTSCEVAHGGPRIGLRNRPIVPPRHYHNANE
jgi:hypothetical protein